MQEATTFSESSGRKWGAAVRIEARHQGDGYVYSAWQATVPNSTGPMDFQAFGRRVMPRSRHAKEIASATEQLGLIPQREHLLTYYAETWEQVFQQDQTTTYPAFMALASVAACWWQGETEPPVRVEVPWWALEVVVSGFMNYTELSDKGLTTTFGQAFGMEESGQGKRPIFAKIRRLERDRNLAFHVALAVEAGASVPEAVANVVERAELSDKTVWRAWGQFGEVATRALANFRTLNSSRSDDRDVGHDVGSTPATRGQRRPRADRKAAKRATRSNKSRTKTKR